MENTNQPRKDFKVISTQHAFMVERTLAKKNYQKKCKSINIDADGQKAVAKQVYKAELNKINAVADEMCAKAQKEYLDTLADIAAREDAFNAELRNYIPNLPIQRKHTTPLCAKVTSFMKCHIQITCRH